MGKKGSNTGAGKTQGLPQGRVTGSNRAGGPTEISSMGGMTMGSNIAGHSMVHVGGPMKGSTKPGMMTGGSKPKGSSVPNKVARFHATRGASKL